MFGQSWEDQWQEFNDEYMDEHGTLRLYPDGPSLDGTDEANADALFEIDKKLSAIKRRADLDSLSTSRNDSHHKNRTPDVPTPMTPEQVQHWMRVRRRESAQEFLSQGHTVDLYVRRDKVGVSCNFESWYCASAREAVEELIAYAPNVSIAIRFHVDFDDGGAREQWYKAHPKYKNVTFEVVPYQKPDPFVVEWLFYSSGPGELQVYDLEGYQVRDWRKAVLELNKRYSERSVHFKLEFSKRVPEWVRSWFVAHSMGADWTFEIVN